MEIRIDARGRQEHKRLLIHKELRARMQGNSIPNEPFPCLIPDLPIDRPIRDLLLNERPRLDGAIDLEAAIGRHEFARVIPAQIVQQRSDGVDFGVYGLVRWGAVDYDGAEEPGSHDVVVGHVVGVGARVGLRGAHDGGVWEGYAGEDLGGDGASRLCLDMCGAGMEDWKV